MESKRKAARDEGDRATKRRKVEDFNLAKGESRESTTVFGLQFLEQIRRTSDKSGRKVATYFEELPPRKGNDEYYRRTRMPISLQKIEQKLQQGYFETLSELESYLKRMIQNAKEFYPRSSSTFEDAERIRKAISNYMVKTNPAYSTRGYQAVPTPLPPDDQEVDSDDERPRDNINGASNNKVTKESEPSSPVDVEDEKKEDKDQKAANEEEPEEPERGSRKIVLKRRASTRALRNTSTDAAQESPRPSRADSASEKSPYKGFNLQQAQEKIIEEILTHKESEYESAYFEPFANLPPRSLKDYYQMIKEPVSLKKLLKLVKGIHGRNDIRGTSDFKTWAQFEEKTKLLWENAYFYNEEDSEIHSLAQELEIFFYKQLKQAQAAVPDPAQPKIKLKIGQQAEVPPSSKKITLLVGGRSGGETESPAPPSSVDSPIPKQETNGIATPGQMTFAPIDKARSASAASPSPSVHNSDVKADIGSPAGAPPPSAASSNPTPLGVTQAFQATPVQPPPAPPPASLPPPPPPPPPPPSPPPQSTPIEPRRLRPAGKGIKDALISNVKIQSYAPLHMECLSTFTILPDAKDMSTSATINLSANHQRIAITISLPDSLFDRQHNLWVLSDKQPLRPNPGLMLSPNLKERGFDSMLHPGINVIEVHLIAAIPLHERIPGGPETELEVFTIFVNVMKD